MGPERCHWNSNPGPHHLGHGAAGKVIPPLVRALLGLEPNIDNNYRHNPQSMLQIILQRMLPSVLKSRSTLGQHESRTAFASQEAEAAFFRAAEAGNSLQEFLSNNSRQLTLATADDGSTALHLASAGGHETAVATLISHGANVD